MSERTIRLHAFCSVKGGVGKSTLATACAKLLAKGGRVPVLVDCDLTGTSLADGLRLRAPAVTLLDDGSINLEAPPTGQFLSVEETRARRGRRRDALRGDGQKWKDKPLPPPYFNDPLNYAFLTGQPARVDALLWRHERDDRVLYLPSSSTHDDVIQSVEWFFGQPFDWARSFAWTLDGLAHQVPALTDVVVDLPPGIWGFPHEALVLVSTLLLGEPMPDDYPPWHAGPVRWAPNPFLVTSRDPNDILPALEYVARQRARVPSLKPVVNRDTEGLNALRAMARARVGPLLEAAGLHETLERVAEMSGLARLFWNGDVAVDGEHREEFREVTRTLRLEDEP
ncbi:P-loop NTPase [Sorangium sp. So ce131]|uniref:nucleotide-binding protein n=1 Tax=Sorangium sp. So ce131 TaxID=3133282 RepID=UPI003F62439E